MEENWLPIVGYENYEVSDLGRVRNVKSGRIMKLKNVKGYLMVGLKQKKYYVHRLVLLTFLPINDKEVNHKNHIKTDNRLENLEWCSRSQNTRFQKKREGCSSKYIGVNWAKDKNKWRASCRINKAYHLGYFDDEREAAKAYNEFIIKHNLQDFAILNDLT